MNSCIFESIKIYINSSYEENNNEIIIYCDKIMKNMHNMNIISKFRFYKEKFKKNNDIYIIEIVKENNKENIFYDLYKVRAFHKNKYCIGEENIYLKSYTKIKINPIIGIHSFFLNILNSLNIDFNIKINIEVELINFLNKLIYEDEDNLICKAEDNELTQIYSILKKKDSLMIINKLKELVDKCILIGLKRNIELKIITLTFDTLKCLLPFLVKTKEDLLFKILEKKFSNDITIYIFEFLFTKKYYYIDENYYFDEYNNIYFNHESYSDLYEDAPSYIFYPYL